jgi:quercetin 2,3-dioxygenase
VSGPVGNLDAPITETATGPEGPEVQLTEDRVASVGRFSVRRALPRRRRRTVGAWCFADHMGPAEVEGTTGIGVGPHPHMGLQTVTWLARGEVLHRDSLGSEKLIRPGQLNLMTAGNGVAHAEEGTGTYRGEVEGLQLWIAQPERTRHGPPAFEHHGELPAVELEGAVGTVVIGELAGVRSPARHDTELLGADLALPIGRTDLPLDARFEHALIVLHGVAGVDGTSLTPGHLAYLGRGRSDLSIATTEGARAFLLGGEPLGEPIEMWWNFVARHRREMEVAYRDWERGDERFGAVRSSLPRLSAPAPYWTTPSRA